MRTGRNTDKSGIHRRSQPGRKKRDIHIFTDCQGAIVSAFHNQIPKNKIGIITSVKQGIQQISEKGNRIHVHWVPGHKRDCWK